ncbi:C-terminal binding protein [Rhizobium leguminosarum]|uniref:C-terminal binding protein n=1 Tax=Rhizobium leguminosarum TaxID=384 RepID=UPI001442745D|nr:C-terminal binding protein [Rhizobium leguminosarum]MBY5899579.1 C-terminal binding protein [Rhizobium leguminosarum]MBY5905781.1 C-terminal binding protein [Rhizobium leguminosarum]NKK89704.1 C-terminal binding protein [Rhizobium leguminosarum bv. viciae]
MTRTVLLTDYAWPDDKVEREVIERAGLTLVSGPAEPSPPAEIDALAAKHQPDAILTCWAQVSETAIAASPNLKIVARLGVGLDNIAVDAATERGIWVTNVPDYCVAEVSDHAVGFAIAWARGLIHFDREVRCGRWDPASANLRRLSELTCGIVGFGRIGRATAAKMQALGCRVTAHDPHASNVPVDVELADFDRLLASSDIVIVHAPLSPATRHLINRDAISKMRRGSLLINVSRGGVVDTAAVIEGLESGILSGVGLDVLEDEPRVPQELIAHPGAMITPHVAFSSDASLIELRRRAAEEVVRVLSGEKPEQPRNSPRR